MSCGEHGAEVVEFSPLTDSELPKNAHALYFGGGYPELHAATLSSNVSLLPGHPRVLRTRTSLSTPSVAFDVLGAKTDKLEGQTYLMAGILPVEIGDDQEIGAFWIRRC